MRDEELEMSQKIETLKDNTIIYRDIRQYHRPFDNKLKVTFLNMTTLETTTQHHYVVGWYGQVLWRITEFWVLFLPNTHFPTFTVLTYYLMIDTLMSYIQQLEIGAEKATDIDLLLTAFTHKSYAADTPDKNIPFNERLEFLWDSLLGAVVATWLYKHHPSVSEAQLTLSKIYLVKETTLAQVARKIELGKYLRLGNGEEKSWWRDKDAVLSDALEALIWYLYLDFGREAVEKLVQKYIITELDILTKAPGKSWKSQLQEFVQKKRKEIPVYENKALEVEDTGNVILYGADVYVVWILQAQGTWKSKKKAQEDGAEKAMKEMKGK